MGLGFNGSSENCLAATNIIQNKTLKLANIKDGGKDTGIVGGL